MKKLIINETEEYEISETSVYMNDVEMIVGNEWVIEIHSDDKLYLNIDSDTVMLNIGL